jgi:hypothetical protein
MTPGVMDACNAECMDQTELSHDAQSLQSYQDVRYAVPYTVPLTHLYHRSRSLLKSSINMSSRTEMTAHSPVHAIETLS